MKKSNTQRSPDKVFVGAHLPAILATEVDRYGTSAGCRNRSHAIENLLSSALRELGYFLPEGVKHRKGAK